MNIDDRYCITIWADDKIYSNADYRDYIVKHIQNELAKPLVAALCTKDAIVAIKGDSTTRKDEYTPGVCCSQDIYVKELVQCKDCRYYRSCYCTYIYQMKIPHSRDFYCAWGERKEDEID